MSRRARTRRGLAVGLAGASLAVGLAACSSSPTTDSKAGVPTTTSASPKTLGGSLSAFAASSATSSVFVVVTDQRGFQIKSLYNGTGSLDSSSDSWSITALPSGTTSDKYQDKLLDVGGVAYAYTPSLPIAVPRAKWVRLEGTLTGFKNGPVLGLALTPKLGAVIVASSSVHWTKGKTAAVLGKQAQGYTATIPASEALSALSAAHTPSSYLAIARTIFQGRPLQLSTYRSGTGKLLAFGFSCAAKGTYDTTTEEYYPLTSSPAAIPAAPKSDVISIARFVQGLEKLK